MTEAVLKSGVAFAVIRVTSSGDAVFPILEKGEDCDRLRTVRDQHRARNPSEKILLIKSEIGFAEMESVWGGLGKHWWIIN